jgi:hypothetical protein
MEQEPPSSTPPAAPRLKPIGLGISLDGTLPSPTDLPDPFNYEAFMGALNQSINDHSAALKLENEQPRPELDRGTPRPNRNEWTNLQPVAYREAILDAMHCYIIVVRMWEDLRKETRKLVRLRDRLAWERLRAAKDSESKAKEATDK